jgi:hypothetical protein
MKKIIGIILLISFSFIGCDLGTGNNDNNNPETPNVRVKTAPPYAAEEGGVNFR